MNILLPIGAAIAAFFVTRKKSKPPISTQPYFSDNGNKICFNKGQMSTYSLETEVLKNSKLYERLFSKLPPPTKENGFNLKEVANQSLKAEFKNFKPKTGEISDLDTPTMKWLYVNHVTTAAFYLALSEKATDLQLAFWLTTDFANELIALGLLIPGQFFSKELEERNKDFLNNKQAISNQISKMFLVVPELKKIQAELLASLLMIGFSQLTNAEIKNNCMTINEYKYGDFTSLSGKIDPYFQNLYNLLFNAFVEAKSI